MAIFIFKCKECGTTMEIIQKFDDPAPICGCGNVMIKQICAANFHLKGGGWANDLYNKNTPIGEKGTKQSESTDTTLKKALDA